MTGFQFHKSLYPKIAILKAAYTFTDRAYIHLDADDNYYYVRIEPKDDHEPLDEQSFTNEMISQSLRHEVYQETKNIRELMLARAMATTVIAEPAPEIVTPPETGFSESEILKDWFVDHGTED